MNTCTLKPGDEIRLKLYPHVPGAVLQPGRVIYVDPKKHFFTVEFTTVSGRTLRESYIPYGERIICSDDGESTKQIIAKTA